MGMGLRFEQDRLSDDLCSGTMGFSQNLGWEMGIGSPLQALNTSFEFEVEYINIEVENRKFEVENI